MLSLCAGAGDYETGLSENLVHTQNLHRDKIHRLENLEPNFFCGVLTLKPATDTLHRRISYFTEEILSVLEGGLQWNHLELK